MAVSRIQEEVIGSVGLPTGDYSFYAGRVESLFRTPVLVALEEYGVPMQLSEKISGAIGTPDDLDAALDQLRALNIGGLKLSGFENEVLTDVQNAV